MTPGTGTSPAELIDLLGDADPDVRLRAALELGESRHDPAAPAIVERFGRERDFYIRETLTWAALRMPVAALPHVRGALDSPRWLARLQALHTLSKVGSPDDVPHLLPLVADPVDAVAARADWAAAQARDPHVVPALVAQLSRGDSEHQNSLTVALGLFGPAAVPALVGALRGGAAPEIRRHAADTLSHMGSPDADDAAPALAAAVADPDEAVRLAALNALGQLVLPSAWAVIDDTAGSADHLLRLLAERLGERRPTEREMRLAELRRRRAGGGARTTTPEQTVPTSGPWPRPDLALVTVEGGPQAELIRPKLARQVEHFHPRHLSRSDVPEAVLARVFEEAEAEALASGRPAALAARIAAGRVEGFVHETVLMEQVSVANPGTTVDGLLVGRGVRVTWFAVDR
ncbi:MAG: HEAT repeat domain-containing protein [Actinomycetes bacterium]|nr:HEAT repeat domain-containing protein [Actinomycetes bacterium]MDX5380133.1 HEAT repeat domain-containing protein [Actinomycetes bacterium]MDX5398752.1 HEAT repeat domain-containing protein [Actinomycetes bacterium]MDX5449848.1 HEAT repeat domain-containing protein [Actinomycetes bacterium]